MRLGYPPARTAARMPVGSGFGAAARTCDLIDGLSVKSTLVRGDSDGSEIDSHETPHEGPGIAAGAKIILHLICYLHYSQ